jgi:serine/threonine-protein kinase
VAGRYDEAVDMMQTAVKLDPLIHLLNNFLANMYRNSGQVERAIEQRKKILELDPGYVDALYALAEDYLRMSMYPEAIASVEKAMSLAGRKPHLVALLGRAYALSGRKDEAETLLKELHERASSEYVLPTYFAEVYASLGNTDEAFRWLEKAYQERNWGMVWLRISPKWDPLRSDPRFDDFVERMNFPEALVSETATKPEEAVKTPIEKIAVAAIKTVSLEPLLFQTSLLMSRGGSIAISPDGKYLVYVGVDTLGTRRLYLRDRMNDFEATPIRGTEGATYPFFRPDGQWIGFFAEDKLRKVSIRGGKPENLCDVPPVPCGGSWGQDNKIVFSQIYHQNLQRITASGGTPEIFATVDVNDGEFGHLWPDILPDKKGVLYTVWTGGDFSNQRTVVKWKDIDKPQVLFPSSSFARYVPTGHIVFLRGGSLWAVPFDINHPGPKAICGEPQILLEDLGTTIYGGTQLAFSRDEGTLTYVSGTFPLGLVEGELFWVDRQGNRTVVPQSRHFYNEWSHPRLSPDESRIVLRVVNKTNLLIYNFKRPGFSLLTSMKGCQGAPVWEPGGKYIAFHNQGPDLPPNVYWLSWESSDMPVLLHESGNANLPTLFSPSGKLLAFTVHSANEKTLAGTSDIWLLEIETKNPTKWTNTPQCSEWGAEFSPNGKWIAFTSNEGGKNEVYVKQYPHGKKEKISTGGGSDAAWGPDGKELFYCNGKEFMRITIETIPKFEASNPELLFEGEYIIARFPGHRNYDISKDGKRFLMIKQVDERPTPVTRLKVVVNWFEELKRLVPTGKD